MKKIIIFAFLVLISLIMNSCIAVYDSCPTRSRTIYYERHYYPHYHHYKIYRHYY